MIAEVNGLVKKYPSFTLSDVSFSLDRGRITGFIGRNGAGKTTTIKSMLNLVRPDSGKVSFFGIPLSGHETEIKQRIGYSAGTISWYPRKKIRDIVRSVKNFYEAWDDTAYRRYRDLFAIDEAKTPLQLSEGMKVKLNLLLALSHRSEVLILDEPTAGLDPDERIRLRNYIAELAQARIVLLATHVVSDIESIAAKVMLLHRGKCMACDTPDALIAAAAGRVGEFRGSYDEIRALQEKYPRGELSGHGGSFVLRVASDPLPEGCTPVAETGLEDVFRLMTGGAPDA